MKNHRRYDIDWIRVIVFDILIIYHVGMFFVPWDWHLKNNDIVEWIRYPMIFINQWRIPILFVVSGMGTRFALSHRSSRLYIIERFKRLFIPLVVGILLIVPPQVYVERLSNAVFSGNYLEFYPHFFNGIYPEGNFSWHHLWFLPYLFVMSLLFTPLFLKLRSENRLSQWFKSLLTKSPLFIYLLAFPLLIVEMFFEPHFPITHAFLGDWYALALYSLLFIIGFFLITLKDLFWTSVKKSRYLYLAIGIIAFPSLYYMWINYDAHILIPILKIVNLWSWILCIFGFAAVYLNKESSTIKYRNRAVYPFYILHQTITVLMGYYMMNLNWHWGLKFLIMVLGTFGLSWVIYEWIILKIPFIQPFFGLKPKRNVQLL